jgi:regulator of protease activity HflC (stomatin/prohibitin superfamily)
VHEQDNVPVKLSGTLFGKVVNAEKSCFSIADPWKALRSVGESSFRAVTGRFDYDEIIAQRNQLSDDMVRDVGRSTDDWGMLCTRFEVQ